MVRQELHLPQGLVVDSLAPADIRYPTDVGLLNQVREQTEKVIDVLYKPIKETLEEKPRTYRKLARKDYLKFAKNKRPSRKQRRKAQKKQLQYIQRNLSHIDQLIEKGAKLSSLSRREYRRFLVVNEIFRQQKQMWDSCTQRIEDRIVSLTQPHIRPGGFWHRLTRLVPNPGCRYSVAETKCFN